METYARLIKSILAWLRTYCFVLDATFGLVPASCARIQCALFSWSHYIKSPRQHDDISSLLVDLFSHLCVGDSRRASCFLFRLAFLLSSRRVAPTSYVSNMDVILSPAPCQRYEYSTSLFLRFIQPRFLLLLLLLLIVYFYLKAGIESYFISGSS